MLEKMNYKYHIMSWPTYHLMSPQFAPILRYSLYNLVKWNKKEKEYYKT
jgi:hypothetical protein